MGGGCVRLGCVGEDPLTRAAPKPSEIGGNDRCRLGVVLDDVSSLDWKLNRKTISLKKIINPNF